MAIEIVEFPIKHGDLMGSNGISDWIYPLVNVYKKLWKDPPFLMGKLTISMAIFNSKLLVYQRVREKVHQPGNPKKIMGKSGKIWWFSLPIHCLILGYDSLAMTIAHLANQANPI